MKHAQSCCSKNRRPEQNLCLHLPTKSQLSPTLSLGETEGKVQSGYSSGDREKGMRSNYITSQSQQSVL